MPNLLLPTIPLNMIQSTSSNLAPQRVPFVPKNGCCASGSSSAAVSSINLSHHQKLDGNLSYDTVIRIEDDDVALGKAAKVSLQNYSKNPQNRIIGDHPIKSRGPKMSLTTKSSTSIEKGLKRAPRNQQITDFYPLNRAKPPGEHRRKMAKTVDLDESTRDSDNSVSRYLGSDDTVTDEETAQMVTCKKCMVKDYFIDDESVDSKLADSAVSTNSMLSHCAVSNKSEQKTQDNNSNTGEVLANSQVIDLLSKVLEKLGEIGQGNSNNTPKGSNDECSGKN